MTEQLRIISSILFNLANLVWCTNIFVIQICILLLPYIYLINYIVLEDKGCPPTMAHLDLRPHPDYIDIS